MTRFVLNMFLVVVALSTAWRVAHLPDRQPPGVADGRTARTDSVAVIEPTPSTAPARLPLSNGQFRGMAIQLHGGDDVYENYHRLIPEVAELGADTVLFVVHGWQTHAGSLDLHLSPQRTAAAKDFGRLLDLAALHGLRRIVMPIVLLKNPRGGEWRGKIAPPGHDWDAWFSRYRQFMVHWADLCEKHNVEVLMVGSELIKAEAYTSRWRETIQEIRQHFRGKLGYSSNWDHYQTDKIGFWGDLDYVGMTTYYKLAHGPNPEIGEIDANWDRIKREILAFQKEVNKPILFTEVGWCSQEGAAKEGWNYYAKQEATEGGRQEQARLYQSFMKAWTDEPCVGGIIWWEWDRSEGGKADYNYTPRGKLAETILRMWFANRNRPNVNGKEMQPAPEVKPTGESPRESDRSAPP
ncbi:MAG: hypothetical protein KF841_16745 [Phycisphaerae bacterium]|nr:hypothetical protein [Phycisphaerae bacterium]